jgi:sugar phosphate isomerase/epimerase
LTISSVNRRHFLSSAAATFGALVSWRGLGAAAAAAETPAIGERLGRIGLQLYTVRQDLARDLEATLAAVAAIGYQEVEFFSPHSTGRGSPREVRAALDRAQLAAPSTHVSSALLYRGWDRHLDAVAALGCRYVVCAGVSPEERRGVRDWHELAAVFNRAGEAARSAGLRFGYHNHDFEFAALEGRVPYDILLSETDPALVRLELDLYWIVKASADPLAYFARWPGRFFAVHVKDMDATSQRGMSDVGAGTIDFARIFAHGRSAGLEHYFVEHDAPAPPAMESARRSYAYLRRLRF